MTSDPTAPSADAAPSSSADDRAHLTLLAEISRAHFLDQKSKVQIAQDYDISRFQVAALVQEARDRLQAVRLHHARDALARQIVPDGGGNLFPVVHTWLAPGPPWLTR